jgi:hypothetical protein
MDAEDIVVPDSEEEDNGRRGAPVSLFHGCTQYNTPTEFHSDRIASFTPANGYPCHAESSAISTVGRFTAESPTATRTTVATSVTSEFSTAEHISSISSTLLPLAPSHQYDGVDVDMEEEGHPGSTSDDVVVSSTFPDNSQLTTAAAAPTPTSSELFNTTVAKAPPRRAADVKARRKLEEQQQQDDPTAFSDELARIDEANNRESDEDFGGTTAPTTKGRQYKSAGVCSHPFV